MQLNKNLCEALRHGFLVDETKSHTLYHLCSL